jgi:hypothetical protein
LTEAEWLACTEPRPMVMFLQGRASDRKLRLHMTAICRRNWRIRPMDEEWLWADRCRLAVEIAERYADGLATADELRAARAHLLDWYDLIEQQDFEGVAAVRDLALVTQLPLTVVTWGPPALIREVFNPFHPAIVDPAWLTMMVIAVAEGIYEDRAFDRLPRLAGVLEDAGCPDAEILDHCRSQAEHVRGCWVVDAILGKE